MGHLFFLSVANIVFITDLNSDSKTISPDHSTKLPQSGGLGDQNCGFYMGCFAL